MQRFRFPIAVALTSLGLVALLVVAGGLMVGSALARGPWGGGFGPWAAGGGPWAHGGGGPWAAGGGPWGGGALPAPLAGLRDVPAAERFDHFQGVQVNLTDKDGQPLALALTPGTATDVSATSLTVAANDGAARTFTLDAQTAIRGRQAQAATPPSAPGIAQGDKVVVVTLNNGGTAMAVWAGNFGAWGAGGPFGH